MRRVHFLDGVRGTLALVVVLCHVAPSWLTRHDAGRACVYVFFLMSGYVLALSYDGRPVTFLVRRLVRLWPVYATCLVAGSVALHTHIQIGELLWLPSALAEPPPSNPPAWSLYYEAWASLFLVPLFAVARRDRWLALMMPLATAPLILIDFRLYFVPIFAMGVAGAGFAIPWPRWKLGPVAWLGQVSFSLYLSHWTVVHVLWSLGVHSPWFTVPACLAVACLVWLAVERPAIAASRRVNVTKKKILWTTRLIGPNSATAAIDP